MTSNAAEIDHLKAEILEIKPVGKKFSELKEDELKCYNTLSERLNIVLKQAQASAGITHFSFLNLMIT